MIIAVKRHKASKEINKLEQEYWYLEEIEHNKAQIHQLKHDTVFREIRTRTLFMKKMRGNLHFEIAKTLEDKNKNQNV